MRTATVYNFLLEANLMASAAILLMIVIRKFLRKPLGNRLIYFLWLLIAVRLLCPLALSNPLINEFRPYYLDDAAIRPIAGQIKIRLTDAADAIGGPPGTLRDSLLDDGALAIIKGMHRGTLAKQVMWVYLCGAGVILLIFGTSNIRFRRRMKANRIERISGKLKEQYLQVCEERGVKPIPVWFADPLPSACLVGVIRPYIALPLTAAPREAVHVLTHEVCHYKGRDHWFNVLRLLCCVIHWFNPLVWLAAFMSRTDCELACDSRVVQTLSQEEKLHYTNTLVLSASRRYAPGVGVLATGMTMTGRKLQNRVRSILNFERTVKWLMRAFTALACIALIAAFFTAEYREYPQMPAVGANHNLRAVQSLDSKEDARRFAEAFFTGSAFIPDLTDAEWMVNETDTTYEVQATRSPDAPPITMTVLKNGAITHFNIPSDMDRAAAVSGLYGGDPDRKAEVAQYILDVWTANQPGVAGTIDALRYASEGAFGDQRFVSFYGVNTISETACFFTVQVLPQVRIVSFHTDSAMLRYLLGEAAGTGGAEARSETIGGFQAMDLASEDTFFTAPTADAMPAGDALEIVLQTIVTDYNENDMNRFRIEYGFVPAGTPGDVPRTPYWQFSFRNNTDPADVYDVMVHAIDGKILYIAGPGEGIG